VNATAAEKLYTLAAEWLGLGEGGALPPTVPLGAAREPPPELWGPGTDAVDEDRENGTSGERCKQVQRRVSEQLQRRVLDNTGGV